MAYAFLTQNRNQQQVRELDLALAGGPDGASPAEVGAANQAAMAALGGMGQVRPRKRASA